MARSVVIIVALVLALTLSAQTKRLQGVALDKYYINRAKEFHVKWAAEEGIVTLESGLQYKVLGRGAGSGAHPTPADTVAMRFQVFVPDEDAPYRHMVGNNVYKDEESGELKGLSTIFKMASLLEGWRRGVELMEEGDNWELYIPYQMAYGSMGRTDTRPAVPVFSPLIVTVWLDKINPPIKEDPQEEKTETPEHATPTKSTPKSAAGKKEDEEHEDL